MKLYVCWTTRGDGWHACGTAHAALREAGHRPAIVHAMTPVRRHAPEPLLHVLPSVGNASSVRPSQSLSSMSQRDSVDWYVPAG